jgi:nicotinamidase-related amidase
MVVDQAHGDGRSTGLHYNELGSRGLPPFSLNSIPEYSMAQIHSLSSAHNRVLLMLDVQVAMLADPPIGVPSAPIIRANISKILSHARHATPLPPLIIHIRNNGDHGDNDEPNTKGWELVHKPLPNEPVLDKFKNNAFAGTRLGELIPTDAEMIVVGMQSDFCVRATCTAALGRGNDVLLIRSAHATYDRQEVWNGGSVTPARNIESEVEAELEGAGVLLLDMKDLPGIFAHDR